VTLLDMSGLSNKRRARKFGHRVDTRKCPACGRGRALILNPYYGVRYCQWAERGLCEFTEYNAVEEAARRQAAPS
jgi:hypothetical protein